MSKLRVLSLFAGIGGLDLGLERTGGFETVAFCEIDPFCRRVLAKHWPDVRQYEDVRELTADTLRRDGVDVDVVCGGFPCQDISIAGRGAGLKGRRSGLWFEFLRLIGELRPEVILVENVAKLRSRGLDEMLRGLDEIGYDAEWHCLPAAYVGAPHRRDRVWVIAYRQGDAFSPYADSIRSHQAALHLSGGSELRDKQERVIGPLAWWGSEPNVERVVDGLPTTLDIARIRAIGNAAVPLIPELIGNAILQSRRAAA